MKAFNIHHDEFLEKCILMRHYHNDNLHIQNIYGFYLNELKAY